MRTIPIFISEVASLALLKPVTCTNLSKSGRLPVHVNTVNTSPTVHNVSDPVSGFAGIPRNMTGFASKLRSAGYATAMVGKWDAGMATPEHTPLGRGYDEWFGYFQHANNYWTKGTSLEAVGEVDICLNHFLDFSHQNSTYRGGVLNAEDLDSSCEQSDADDPECYESSVFKRQGLRIIQSHDPRSGPLLYVHAFHLVHTPLQVPQSYITKAEQRVAPGFFNDRDRKVYSAMVHYLDDVVGDLVDAFKQKGMWQNTLVVFFSDNGGPIYSPGGANNHPLKGGKFGDWEGGIRTNAFLSGGFVPASLRGSAYHGIVSVADWYGLFCELAGVNATDVAALEANEWLVSKNLPQLAPVDSVSGLWQAIVAGNNENLRPVLHISENAVIQYPYKLVTGSQIYSLYTGELYPNCTSNSSVHPWFTDLKVFDKSINQSTSRQDMDQNTFVQECHDGCLYNIAEDPNEHTNLATLEPTKLAALQHALSELNKSLFRPYRGVMSKAVCDSGFKNGGYYGPFVDSEDYFTGPFPRRTLVQKLKDVAFKKAVDTINRPLVEQEVVHLAEKLIPNKIGPSLQSAFDQCLFNASETKRSDLPAPNRY